MLTSGEFKFYFWQFFGVVLFCMKQGLTLNSRIALNSNCSPCHEFTKILLPQSTAAVLTCESQPVGGGGDAE